MNKIVKPLVSVILVSYNTRDLTVKSIKSAQGSVGFAKGEIEVIVVDNNSADDTVMYLKKNLPEVTLIVNKENRGFGGGNNQGVDSATGKYVLLLNTDAFLEKNTLRTLVDILEKDKKAMSVAPQLRYANGDLQVSAGYAPTPRRVIAWMLWLDKLPLVKKLFPDPYHVYDLRWYQEPRRPDWLMGACVLFRRQEFREAGGFDDKIFMYAEEVELYNRMALSHPDMYNIMTTRVRATHLGSASTKKANAYRLALELKGIEYIYHKHSSGVYWLIKAVIVLGVLMRMGLYTLIPARHDALVEYKKYFTT